MKTGFDYKGALKAGYSDDEIMGHLAESNPKFDIQGAIQAGYSPQEINQHLSSSSKPKRGAIEKGARIAGQFALGAAENAALPYELAAASLASPQAQEVAYKQNVMEDIERLAEQKQTGVWDQQHEELLENLIEQIKNPEKARPFVQTADIGVRGIAEKVTGQDLHPEGVAEKAANWMGFIKNPKNIASLVKDGLKSKDIMKAILPTGTDALRGVGAGTALQLAEEGNFGPIGTMAAVVVGDLAGAGAAGLAKGVGKLVTKPKQALAEAAAKFSSAEKKELQKQIIKDFRESGVQADLGTITDSQLVKWTQSRLAQSGLTGKAMDQLKSDITSQIKEEYKQLADSLGEARFATTHEAGEIAKEGLKKIRDADLAETRGFYNNARSALKEQPFVDSKRIANAIENLEKELKHGQLKSSEQKTVLDTLDILKRDVMDSSGKPLYADVRDLMNNKIALNDIINYEVQGGAKQLLKSLVGELDRAIISHGKENPKFTKNYIMANKRFAEHAKTFRNKSVDAMLRTPDPATLLNKMKSVQGIRDMGKILSKTPEGREIFRNLKRLQLDKVIGDGMVDSTTQQLKHGNFAKLLEVGKNKEIIKEILGPQGFKRLERLQKNSGKLAEANSKFFNASQSGTSVTDAAILGKLMNDVYWLLHLNPFPFIKTVGGIAGTRKLSALLADPEFLKLVEEIILKSEKGTPQELVKAYENVRPYALLMSDQSQE